MLGFPPPAPPPSPMPQGMLELAVWEPVVAQPLAVEQLECEGLPVVG